MRLVVRLNDGGKAASLSRESGIFRQSGYTVLSRQEGCGLKGLGDRSRLLFQSFGKPASSRAAGQPHSSWTGAYSSD
mgnify:CR=1 FL=1|jgi:hypothetical protein